MFADVILSKKRNGQPNVVLKKNGNNMDIWIARDEDSRMFMHFNEPILDNIGGHHWQSFPYLSMINIDNTPIAEQYKDLKYSDKPIKLKLKL